MTDRRSSFWLVSRFSRNRGLLTKVASFHICVWYCFFYEPAWNCQNILYLVFDEYGETTIGRCIRQKHEYDCEHQNWNFLLKFAQRYTGRDVMEMINQVFLSCKCYLLEPMKKQSFSFWHTFLDNRNIATYFRMCLAMAFDSRAWNPIQWSPNHEQIITLLFYLHFV